MTYYCSECVTNWAPYMTDNGMCPECRTGTKRQPNEPMTTGIVERHRIVVAARLSASKHAHFDAYYAAREATRTVRD
jgi:hypothetical protein